MDAKEALKERTEMINNVFQFKHNNRSPLISNFFTWKILDAGYKLNEAMYDYDLLEKIMDEFHHRYQFDVYMDIGTRNSMGLFKALGGKYYQIDPAGEILMVEDHHIMEREEYQEYIKNPTDFFWSKSFKRYCKPGITMGELENAAKEYYAFVEFAGMMTNKAINEYGVLLQAAGVVFVPFESIFNMYRGIQETALDVRKCKDQMKEAMEVMYTRDVEPVLQKMVGSDYTGYMAPLVTGILGHSILSVKQFEELYWPYFKKIIDFLQAHNLRMFLFCESKIERFVEFLQDVPKGVFCMNLEQDNIFEIRKKLPNIALTGGMTTNLLGNGTKEQCIDYAKKLIDTLGDGYAMCQDKMMSYRNDAKRENLIAVNEFVRNYQS